MSPASQGRVLLRAIAAATGIGGVAVGVALAQTTARPDRPGEAPRRQTAPALVSPPALPAELEASTRARYQSPDVQEAAIDPARYVLGPGDVLALSIFLGEAHVEQLPVLPEGVVVVPNVGPVTAAGRTLDDFRTELRAAVARRYRDVELSCYLARQRQFRVYVTGRVRQPGTLAARPTERVSDVVERAGGLDDEASRRSIELVDSTGVVSGHVDLARFLALGDLRANPTVQVGQVVRVPPRGPEAAVTGEVRAPGSYERRDDETVADFLALAGGLTAQADSSQVALERTDPGGGVRVESIDLQTQAGTSAAGVTRITVLSTLLGKRRVFYISPTDEQQTLYLGQGETLRDLVRRIGDLPVDADLGAAELATRDSIGQPVQVPVDVNRVLAGLQDRPLQDGDVLSVPGVRGYVYVSGQVSRPGRYVYRAEWTVNDYLGEAGGPTTMGSRDEVAILGSDGRKRAGNRATAVRRGETVHVDRSLSSRGSGVLVALINVTALIVSVVALTK